MIENGNKEMPRYLGLQALMATVMPRYLSPLPCSLTIRRMLQHAGIPHLRVRGNGKGARIFYDRLAVEDYFSRLPYEFGRETAPC